LIDRGNLISVAQPALKKKLSYVFFKFQHPIFKALVKDGTIHIF